jgi:hypothetical protein
LRLGIAPKVITGGFQQEARGDASFDQADKRLLQPNAMSIPRGRDRTLTTRRGVNQF